jgi:hypothetical protein
MTIRLTLLILTAALTLAASSTALAADGTAVGRWAQPAASQPDAEQAVGRWSRSYRPEASLQPQPRQWRRGGSLQPQPRFWRPRA